MKKCLGWAKQRSEKLSIVRKQLLRESPRCAGLKDFNCVTDAARHLIDSVTPRTEQEEERCNDERPCIEPTNAVNSDYRDPTAEELGELTEEQKSSLNPKTRFLMWSADSTASFIQIRKLEILFFLLEQFGTKWTSALNAAGCGVRKITGEEFCFPGWTRTLDEIERFCVLRGWRTAIKSENLEEIGTRLADFMAEKLSKPATPFWATAEGFGVMPDFGAASMHRITAEFFRTKMSRNLPAGIDAEIGRAPDAHRIDAPTADQRIFTKIAHTLAVAGMPTITAASVAAAVGIVESYELDADTKVFFSKKRRITDGFRQLALQKRREALSLRRQLIDTKDEVIARNNRRKKIKEEAEFFAAAGISKRPPILRRQAMKHEEDPSDE